jgi:hypothetical protein
MVGTAQSRLCPPYRFHDLNFKQPICLQIQLRDLATGSREFCLNFLPLKIKGAGNAGRPMRPQPRVRNKKHTSKSPRSRRKSPDIPYAMVLTAYFALPGDRAFLPPSPRGNHSAKLDASVGASGPHDFAVRDLPRPSCAAIASTASRPASVTIAIRPHRDETAGVKPLICPDGLSEIFFRRGLDDPNHVDPAR